jgi:hypothetical protein
MLGITLLMITFGYAGYATFGDDTLAPITLNLAGTIYATFVKIALCVALYFTFPMMMFPVHDVLEDVLDACYKYMSTSTSSARGTSTKRLASRWSKQCLRATVVCASAWIAYSIPDFGKFLSLVGSSVCTLLGFILPCWFHLQVFHGKEETVLVVMQQQEVVEVDHDEGVLEVLEVQQSDETKPRIKAKSLMWWQWALDWFLIGFGIIFGILGTIQSWKDLRAEEQQGWDNVNGESGD